MSNKITKKEYLRRKKIRRIKKILKINVMMIVLFSTGFLLKSKVMSSEAFATPNVRSVEDEQRRENYNTTGDYPENLLLVNKDNPLSDDYSPELEHVEEGHYVDKQAAAPLKAMLAAARKEGLSPLICSSYRSVDRQTQLFHKQIKKQQGRGLTYDQAYEEAKTVVAYPGTSEHNAGLAVDLVSAGYQQLEREQMNTAEAKWLKENGHKYGFILRYPEDKQDITGVIFEPWHFRYVGIEAATEIMEKGICLEEYFETLE